MEKISIIVPVYNVQNFIGECIESLINQSYKNVEIILVDDGSTDNSGKICDQYASNDHRIKVLHVPNGGVSRARNLGLANASGTWISFVDGDDWLDLNFCQKLIDNSQNSDIVFCRPIKNYENNQTATFYETTLKELSQTPYNLEHLIHDRIHSESNGQFITDCILCVVWRTLLKTQIIVENNLLFEEGIKALEDRLFIMQYLSLCKNGALVDEYLYHYRMRASSVTHENKYRPELFEERKFLLKKEVEIILKNQNISQKNRVLLAKAQTSKLWWSVVSHEAYLNPNYKKQLNYYVKHGGVENPFSFKFLWYLKKNKYSLKRVAMFALIKFKAWGLFKKFLYKA